MPSLILLPGLDGTGLLFEPLLRALGESSGAKVIAYPPNRALGLADLAAHVQRDLPEGKAVLLAESFSSLVALALLAASPSRFEAVIFVGGFAEPPRPLLLRFAPLLGRSPQLMKSAPAFLLRQYCVGGDATAEDLARLRNALSMVSSDVLAQRLVIVGARHDFGRAAFDVPCCYIRATGDRLVPATAAEWFRKRFRKLHLQDVDGPHFLLQARPNEAARAVRGFLEQQGIVEA